MHMMVYFETSMVEEARFIEVFLQVYCGQVRLLQRETMSYEYWTVNDGRDRAQSSSS